MSEKRKRDRDEGSAKDARKKQKRGFVVGPDNLPDGTHRRKNQEIKRNLIEKAKIWKGYEKLKRQGKVPDGDETLPQPASLEIAQQKAEPTTAPHPERQNLIDREEEAPQKEETRPDASDRPWERTRRRNPKAEPFRKEYEQAQQRKAEAEERRKAREEAERQRQQKTEERERFRRAMAKARTGGPNGQRKLGRESAVLLEKVKRMVGNSG